MSERLRKIALGKTTGADDMLDLVYGYGSTANNDNVMSQTISVEDVAQCTDSSPNKLTLMTN